MAVSEGTEVQLHQADFARTFNCGGEVTGGVRSQSQVYQCPVEEGWEWGRTSDRATGWGQNLPGAGRLEEEEEGGGGGVPVTLSRWGDSDAGTVLRGEKWVDTS